MQYSSRPHRSRKLLLMAPTANPPPAPPPAAPGILTPDNWPAAASPDAESALDWLNANAIPVLALLICGLFAAIALYVVLQCACRVAARAWYAYGHRSGAVPQEPAPRAGNGGGGSSAKLEALALPCLAYSEGLRLAGSSRAECAICLTEFARGEQLRVLPRCNHGFHARCIDRWLAARPTCPTCRQATFAESGHERVLVADRARPAPVVRVVRVIAGGGVGRRAEI
ncbi:hypothetical protein ACQ4PT_065561 [Festuca glaucescens]